MFLRIKFTLIEEWLAQLMTFTDPDLEKFYVFCKVFYKYLPYTRETLPMELLGLIDLDKLRIQLSYEGALTLEDEEATLAATRIGEVSQRREEEERTVAEILDMANSPFANILNENDKIVKQLWDDLMKDPEVLDAFRAGNSYDVLMNIVKEKFDDAIVEQIDKYLNFKETLEKERGFSFVLISKFVQAIAQRTAELSKIPYDEEALKLRIVAALQDEFQEVCNHLRTLPEITEGFFRTLHTPSLPKLDGVDGQLKQALNNIYANPHLNLVEKQVFFSQLVQKYEAFLKKLYYLIHHQEVEGTDGKGATLSNAIHAFNCLWKLKNSETDEGRKFSTYLQMVRDWRNEEAHAAPSAKENEISAGIKVAVAMYLYVTAYYITELERAGH